MNVPATKLGLVLDPPASFPGELHILPKEDFLQATHDALELTAITHKLRLSAGTPLFSHVPVIIVMMTGLLLASRAFPVVG